MVPKTASAEKNWRGTLETADLSGGLEAPTNRREQTSQVSL
jgi:hypothetical protein